ncbi:MAG TPA: hypothetical protein VFF91_10715 [Pseudoxanthomonas sp.]|nr:hypothetical protein [Pseudoxanthomonas sp.]
MSDTPARPRIGTEPRIGRLQPWIAALLSTLLHVAFLLILLWSAKPVVTPPQGKAGGGRVRVDFVGQPQGDATPAPPSPRPSPAPAARSQPAQRPSEPRKPVLEARFIEPPPAPAPGAGADAPSDSQARAPAASSPSPAPRRPETWTGRPPGLLEDDVSAADGRASGPVDRDGQYADMAAGEPSMQVGGYQIVYDLIAEERLRAWMAQGVRELSIPLPGTHYHMVCPAEVALRRGSSRCRLLEPGSPEMQGVGDARDVITIMYVYRQGKLVWRGPGPYR